MSKKITNNGQLNKYENHEFYFYLERKNKPMMNFTPIDPHDKISPHQMFQLFWFDKYILHQGNNNYKYTSNFHITESLIQKYNELMQIPITDEYDINGNLERSCNTNMNIDKGDIKNVLYSAQILMQTKTFESIKTFDVLVQKIAKSYSNVSKSFTEKYWSDDLRFAGKPVIWDITRDHDDYMCKQLELGEIMEVFVDREFKKNGLDIGRYFTPEGQNHGETAEGIEIKHDMMSQNTGNFYIELCETHKIKSQGFTEAEDYIPSGILKDDNTKFFLVGTPDKYYIVCKNDLIRHLTTMDINNSKWQDGTRWANARGSKGFIVKEEKLKDLAISNDIGEFTRKYLQHEIDISSKTHFQSTTLDKIKSHFIVAKETKPVSNDKAI